MNACLLLSVELGCDLDGFGAEAQDIAGESRRRQPLADGQCDDADCQKRTGGEHQPATR